ncbi:MAG: RNase adapter RapZ [Nitrospirae bacterium]|nr:RNase adapter RapZ [Nitrospirota bacterium]
MNQQPAAAAPPGGAINFLILTGTSGAGKSHALNFLEDIGFFCVDNLPLGLLTQFADLCARSSPPLSQVALVIDVRERASLDASGTLIQSLRGAGHRVETLFFDADDAVLIRRFSETRRPHPLSPDGSVSEGLAKERRRLEPLRNTADRRVDTSAYSVHDLKAYLQRHYGGAEDAKQLTISLVAFGFKFGVPLEADLLFDVRFLANPHFVPELKPKTGESDDVRDYVMADPRSEGVIRRINDLLAFTIPEYEHEGRNYLTIGVGCTGGKHRSVVVARALAERLTAAGHRVELRLRDAHGASPGANHQQ